MMESIVFYSSMNDLGVCYTVTIRVHGIGQSSWLAGVHGQNECMGCAILKVNLIRAGPVFLWFQLLLVDTLQVGLHYVDKGFDSFAICIK
jgi:hypothetical protein